MKQWKVFVVIAGLLVLISRLGRACGGHESKIRRMVPEYRVWEHVWSSKTRIIGNADKDFRRSNTVVDNSENKLKLGEDVFTINLGREVFRNKNLGLSLEGGINHHPEDKRCATPVIPDHVDYATPVEILVANLRLRLSAWSGGNDTAGQSQLDRRSRCGSIHPGFHDEDPRGG